MSRYRYHIRTDLGRRSGVSGRVVAGCFIFLAAICSVLYLLFTPGFSDHGQLTCSLSSDSLGAVREEAVSVPSETPSIQAATHSGGCFHEITDVSGPDDSLFSLLYANLLNERTARDVATGLASVIRPTTKKRFDAYSPLKSGTRYSITVDQQGGFRKGTVELDPANVFHAMPEGDKIKAWKEEVVLDFKVEALHIKVHGSIAESLANAGEGVELALKLTNIFRWDIDFQSESMRGDVCKVLFERRYADDQPSGYGRILCAVYEGRKTGRKTAVLFNDEYFDEHAVELKKNFLRSPLSVIRVTSRFGQRFHPILRQWRRHCGVDYGAPTGTPVWSIASGVVTFSGWQNGYGNYVCVQHDTGYESRYGHLSRIFVRKGQRVKQRQRIGLVGQTGRATGPHLDFQLLRAGKHLNPLNVRMVRSLRSVPSPLKPRFTSVAHERFSYLDSAASAATPAPASLASAH